MSDNGDDPIDGLRLMVAQMIAAEEAALHFPALMTALTVPDICGALGSENGRASGSKTRRWIAEWMPAYAATASGIYGLRCSLLHQGSPYPDDGSPRVVFSVAGPKGTTLHGPGSTLIYTPTEETFRPIASHLFVAEVAAGVEAWLLAHGATNRVRRNLARFAHLRSDGVPPFIKGGSFIA